ncbi:MAG TPA: MobF family relaxase [Opitutaceae bacterium]|jgi:conjugative relaxase-like TrwC/TraI family protein|nr:MobF family relaxase [Opitutaceae bacterium]
MLSPKTQLSLNSAKEYFREHLCVGDYYAEGQKISGEWFGEAAEKLGLKGRVGEKEFLALCEGLNPTTGEWLTMRKNSTRVEDGKVAPNRRVFYDFTFSPPKSVSIVALFQDVRIIELHDRAVRAAMLALEKFAETRVRNAGQDSDRVTGNLVGAMFQHDTSRELDPQLHTHCVMMNATFDPAENRWKALQAAGMYRAQKFAENAYYHVLAQGLPLLGYELESNKRDFEIKGVPASLIKLFSKRHQQIDEETQKRVEKEGLRGNVKELRKQVAHDERKRKIKDSTADRLRPSWAKQMTADERSALIGLCGLKPQCPKQADIAAIMAWADQHLFERRSVVQEHELLSAALAHGRGQTFDLSALKQAIEARDYVRDADTRQLTSRETLRCELGIVMAARDGRGLYAPFNPDYAESSALSAEQGAAVKQILGSEDFITLFRGGAGTGKSFALKEVERGLSAAGRPVVVLAPQRQQVSDLTRDGLPAQTVAQILTTKQLPTNTVVIVDEAGQIGGRQLHELIRLVKAQHGQLILSGDTRQHGAVAASDALRAIERYGYLKAAEIQEIRRQNPALGKSNAERSAIHEYRAAVKAAAAGNVVESFDRLDRMGCVRELNEHDRRDVLAKEYVEAVARKEKPLVVAQTWNEVRAVNEAIREQLKTAGKLGPGKVLTAYQTVDGTEAQKREARFYEAGQSAYFLQRYGRFAKGDLCEIRGATERGVVLVKNGRCSTLSYRYTDRIAVAASSKVEIAPGDRLQLKFNGKSTEGAPLNNGELVTVHGVRKNGLLVVEDEAGTRKTLAPSQRLFNRGYAVTSYASQGKTVDTVLIADAANRATTNHNQWYVAISRGRKNVVVFTSDKEELRASVQRTGDRKLALDLKPTASVPAEPTRQQVRRGSARKNRAWETIQSFQRHQFIKKANLRMQPAPAVAPSVRQRYIQSR